MALSLTHKRWILPANLREETAQELLSRLKAARGLDDCKSVLPDPEDFPAMPRAVQRIQHALGAGERIGIFGDYDCDGITASALLLRCLQRHGADPLLRLPHRIRDGYGLHEGIVQELSSANVQLLITADTGVSSRDEIALANGAGIDVIVTDHHALPAVLPAAYAIVHPALAPRCGLPHPSGAGMAYQLVRALEGGAWADQPLDCALAMIGTIADVVELQGQNRALVQEGLAALAICNHQPLLKLLELCNLTQDNVTSTDVAFRIAPRINAAGRMAGPQLALEAILEGGDALSSLDTLNRERRDATESGLRHALDALNITKTDIQTMPPLLAAASTTYGHGILGLIAGKLTEQYGRPSLVATRQENMCTASLRSPAGYNVAEGLSRCADLLERHGGHAQAAGCTFRRAQWEPLQQRLSADIAAHVQEECLQPSIGVDAVLLPTQITLEFLETLRELEPHGAGNAAPRFLIKGICFERMRCVGANQQHLQAHVGNVKSIGFGLGHLLPECDTTLDIVCELQENVWGGYRKPQITIVDIRRAEK